MIRKFALAVAIVAVGFIVAAPAQAGGSSGAKKSATLRSQNKSNASVYGVAVPNGKTANTVGQAQALGAKQIPVGGVGSFPVAPGAGALAVCWAKDLVGLTSTDPLPDGDYADYSAQAGKTGYSRISGDVADPTPTIEPGFGPF